MKEKIISFKLPLPKGGTKSQSRQLYIKSAKEIMPDLEKGNTMWDQRKYHVDIEFSVGPNFMNDIDNMLKCLFDAMKGRIFPDDSQIESMTAAKVRNDKKAPGTYIDVYKLNT